MIERRAIALFIFSSLAFAQSDFEPKRFLWNGAFKSHRIQVQGHNLEPNKWDTAYLGVTIWRLPSPRAVKSPGPKPPSPAGSLERVTPETRLGRGDQFRITLEPARAGYLYLLKDMGRIGDTKYMQIVYPASGLSAKDNYITPASVTVIPAASEQPSFLTSAGSYLDSYVALLTPRPIPDSAGLMDGHAIDAEMLANWKGVWSYPAGQLTSNEAPAAISPAEAEILSGRSSKLTQQDPLPQNLYHSETPLDEPLIFDLDKSFNPDSPRRFGIGSFSGFKEHHLATPPAPAVSSRVTAAAFLTPGQDEPPGGLYSYILFGQRPESFDSPRWNRYFQAILAYLNLPAAGDVGKYLPPEKLNLTFFPLTCSSKELPASSMQPIIFQFDPKRVEAHRMEHLASGKPFAGHGKTNADTACALVSSYDYSRAQRLLALLPGSHLEGPYIVSTAQPLSKASELPAQFLYQDLSSVPPDLVGLWFREFMAQAQEPEFWKTRSANQFVLRLRTVIGIASEQVPDFRSSVVWAFIAPPKK
jgi:hypothetical protein